MNSLTHSRIEQRKDNFMKGSTKEMMEKSGTFAVSLRKSKRQQAVKKYREKIRNATPEDETDERNIDNDLKVFPSQAIENLLNSMNQENYLSTLENINYMCRGNLAFELINYPELIKRLIPLLNNQYEDKVSMIIMDLFISLTSGPPSTTFEAMKYVGYDNILYCLDPLRPLTSYKTLKVLSNLAADSSRIRFKLLDLKAHEYILSFCNFSPPPKTYLKIISKFFVDMSSEHDSIPNEVFDLIFPLLKTLLYENDTTTISQSLQAINTFCKENQTRILSTSTQDFLNIIISLCTHTSMNIIENAIAIIGNLSFCNKSQSQFLIENNIFDLFCTTIEASSSNVRKETAYAISNIIADGDFYIEKLITHRLIDKVIEKLEDHDPSVQRETSYIMFNLSSKGHFGHFKVLIDKWVFNYMKFPLLRNDSKVILNLLSFIYTVLETYKANDCYEAIESMEETQCIITIESLRKTLIPSLYNKIEGILSFFQNDFLME